MNPALLLIAALAFFAMRNPLPADSETAEPELLPVPVEPKDAAEPGDPTWGLGFGAAPGQTLEDGVTQAFIIRQTKLAVDAVIAGTQTPAQETLLHAASEWCAPGEVGGRDLGLPCDSINWYSADLKGTV